MLEGAWERKNKGGRGDKSTEDIIIIIIVRGQIIQSQESDLARAEASAKLSLFSKLGSPPHRSLVQLRPMTTVIRAEAIVNIELSLLSKLRAITALELGSGAMAGSNPKGC